MYSRYKIVIKNYLFVKKKKNRDITDVWQILIRYWTDNKYKTDIKQIYNRYKTDI